MHIHTYVSMFLFVHDIFFAFRSFYSVFGYSYITCVFGENWLRAIHAFVTVLLFYFICCFCFIFFPSFSVSFCCASANLKMLFRRSTHIMPPLSFIVFSTRSLAMCLHSICLVRFVQFPCGIFIFIFIFWFVSF